MNKGTWAVVLSAAIWLGGVSSLVSPDGAAALRPSPRPSLVVEPAAIRTLVRPDLYDRASKNKEILTSARLDGRRYSIYAIMLVHASLERTRRILTDYSLYSKLVPYVDKTQYSPITHVLDLEGGVWKWKLRSWVRFDEKSDRWIHFEIVGGHFTGLQGDMLFEGQGERGTLVYFRGEQTGDHWPPQWVIERGAEIVFGYTAGRMRKYLESNEDHENDASGPANGNRQDLPKPRSHL